MFQLDATERDGTLEVRLVGELDLAAFDTVDEHLEQAQLNGQPDVTLDLRGLTFMDSSGIRAILRALGRAEASNGRLRLIPGPPHVQRVFEISGVEDRLEFVEPE
jgi:anti-sigma B factor antagonist